MDYLTTRTSLSPIRRGFAPGFLNYKKGCTRLAVAIDKVYQLLAHGRWFSAGTPASSTTKTGRNDIAEILLKVALNTINQIKSFLLWFKLPRRSWISHPLHTILICRDISEKKGGAIADLMTKSYFVTRHTGMPFYSCEEHMLLTISPSNSSHTGSGCSLNSFLFPDICISSRLSIWSSYFQDT